MCKYSKHHFSGTPSATQTTAKQQEEGPLRKDPECSTTKDNKLALSLKIMCYLPWNLIWRYVAHMT